MIEALAITLLALWLFGTISGYKLGNFIYVLLVAAFALLVARLVGRGREVR